MGKKTEQLAASLGQSISVSRRARGMKQQELADQIDVGMNTMVAIEKGLTTVQFGHYLNAMIALGMETAFANIINFTADIEAVSAMANKLPKRVNSKSRYN